MSLCSAYAPEIRKWKSSHLAFYEKRLSRCGILDYKTKGRSSVSYGHKISLFDCKSSKNFLILSVLTVSLDSIVYARRWLAVNSGGRWLAVSCDDSFDESFLNVKYPDSLLLRSLPSITGSGHTYNFRQSRSYQMLSSGKVVRKTSIKSCSWIVFYHPIFCFRHKSWMISLEFSFDIF